MSAFEAISDRVRGRLQSGAQVVKSRLLGANNERLDLLMDSFNKLSPGQRSAALAGVAGVIGLFVLGAVGLYFTQVNRLKSDLSNSFAAVHELQRLSSTYELERANYEELLQTVRQKTGDLRPKPFFEKIANDLGVTIEGLDESRNSLPEENPLSDKLKLIEVEMRMPKISVPRLMNFLVEVEKANKYLRVADLKIRGRYGDKLFFDAEATVRGYEVTR